MQLQSTNTHTTPYLTSLRLPVLFQPRFVVIVFARKGATILDKISVVSQWDFSELPPLEVLQIFVHFFVIFQDGGELIEL